MNKHDRSNYTQHPAKIIAHANIDEWIDLGIELRSSLLLIEWQIKTPIKDRHLSVSGKMEIEIISPLGKIAPIIQTLNVSFEKLIQLVTIPLTDNLSYKLRFQNPSTIQKSQIWISEFIPYIPSVNLALPASNMSSISNPVVVNTTTDPAVAAGIAAMVQGQAQATQIAQQTLAATNQSISVGQANAALIGQAGQAILATTAAVIAADETKQVTDVKSDNFAAGWKFDPQVGYQLPADVKTRVITLTNNNPAVNVAGQPPNPFAGAQFKVIVGTQNLPATSTPYAAITKFYQGILTSGGTMEISDPTCRDEIYIISSIDQAPIYVAKTFQV
jgi:hypothetical protein